MNVALYAKMVPYTRLYGGQRRARREAGRGTYAPPAIDIAHAPGAMTSECASTRGSAKPVTTTNAVMNRPRSTGPDPSYSVEKSSPPQRENMAFGRGATTKVKAAGAEVQVRAANHPYEISDSPTRSGSQLPHSAHDRMMRRNPTASTNESRMTAGIRV